jgi:glycosyltransferase involved in cell wall biosynthesis
VSVIVPVRDRRDLLRGLLAALDAQTYTDFELIVVDDGSTDGSDDEAEQATVAGRPVVVLHQRSQGAVAARKRGVEGARGEILAFTDSDCLPQPEWLSKGVAGIDSGADVVDGRTVPTRHVRPLERSIWQENDGLYATCNVFYRRTAFMAVGGFDEDAARRLGFRFTPWARGLGFGEDTVLGWRVARAGSAQYAEEAVVLHHVFPGAFREWLTRSWMMAAFPALLREVPEIKPNFIRYRVQFGTRTRAPVYATLLAIALGKRRVAAITVLWWAKERFRYIRPEPLPWSRRCTLLAEEMVIDVIQAAALTAGSIRARTLAL